MYNTNRFIAIAVVATTLFYQSCQPAHMQLQQQQEQQQQQHSTPSAEKQFSQLLCGREKRKRKEESENKIKTTNIHWSSTSVCRFYFAQCQGKCVFEPEKGTKNTSNNVIEQQHKVGGLIYDTSLSNPIAREKENPTKEMKEKCFKNAKEKKSTAVASAIVVVFVFVVAVSLFDAILVFFPFETNNNECNFIQFR
jgi:hypothetical protein